MNNLSVTILLPALSRKLFQFDPSIHWAGEFLDKSKSELELQGDGVHAAKILGSLLYPPSRKAI